MKTCHKNIVSYYSECDYSLDAIYSIDYPDDIDIGYELEKAYEELMDQDKPTNELSCMLDYLIKQGMEIKYDTIAFDIFDCECGRLKEY